ncbi:unnamed protein product [Paramecium octaurelia]|uniref:Uncharacterized protein n=1 Tax=Paramecium octaurelia TaxID=43137 RepID=A0A8S1SZY7_PAROT|nr:unnamed protein product [Paramecium octaurelia]
MEQQRLGITQIKEIQGCDSMLQLSSFYLHQSCQTIKKS